MLKVSGQVFGSKQRGSSGLLFIDQSAECHGASLGRIWDQSKLAINQSMFYFISVHSEVIVKQQQQQQSDILAYYTNLPTGLRTIGLTIDV